MCASNRTLTGRAVRQAKVVTIAGEENASADAPGKKDNTALYGAEWRHCLSRRRSKSTPALLEEEGMINELSEKLTFDQLTEMLANEGLLPGESLVEWRAGNNDS